MYWSATAVPDSIGCNVKNIHLFSWYIAQCWKVKSTTDFKDVFSLAACGLRKGCMYFSPLNTISQS